MRHLTDKEESRIKIAIADHIMHFAPTISPAPKSFDRAEIESLAEAMKYYHEQGEAGVIIQRKYMGSYCDIYLHRDLEKTKFFSRSGYRIPESRVSQDELLKAVYPHWKKFFAEDNGIMLAVIQAELLPWAALGAGLIESEFGGYATCHQTHLDYLRDTNLSLEINKLFTSEYSTYHQDKKILSKKDLEAKYLGHIRSQYEAMKLLELPDTQKYQAAIDLYNQQLKIYGQPGEIELKPFGLLKVIWEDGREEIVENNILSYRAVAVDDACEIDFSKQDLGEAIAKAYEFFNKLVLEEQMEGIVIKPITTWNQDMVPMFKVRNVNYLQMIYGIKFQDNYGYYLEKRNIGKKMRCSKNEWNLAQSLLRIPFVNIKPDNEEYIKLVSARILEEDFEGTLDKRL